MFSYGTGTTVNISNSTIRTSADNSGGIQTTGGGTTNASDLTVETSGNSAAAIRSDRGGGTVNVDGGSSASHGWGTAVEDNAVVTIGAGCTWTLTGDCTLTSLTNNGTINFNGHTITLADGTVLK